jgi:hypothetical protein
MFEGFLQGGAHAFHALYPADLYTADLLAAAVEAHHADYVSGNTFVNTTAAVPIHYGTDHGLLENDRIGTLWFYNNSFYEPSGKYYGWCLFDTSGGGGNSYHEIEWPQLQVLNNAIWLESPTKPYFYWNLLTTQFMTLGKNVINTKWGTGNIAGGEKTGWNYRTSNFAFQGASDKADMTGAENLIEVSSAPFNLTTFAATSALVNRGAALPGNWPRLPVRFQYGPFGVQAPRKQPLTIGAME